MAELTLTKTAILHGVWRGELSGAPEGSDPPELEVTHRDAPVPGVELSALPDGRPGWAVRIPVPAAAISEGLQTVLISDRDSGARLGSFAVLAGDALDADLRAEVDLLRAELDLLKRAFRRHCSESEA